MKKKGPGILRFSDSYDSGKTDYISTICKGFDWDQYAIFVVKIEVEFFAQIKGYNFSLTASSSVTIRPFKRA